MSSSTFRRPSLKDWLPEDHLAFFLHDAVAEIDLSALYADYRADGWGDAAHDTKLIVALQLWAANVGFLADNRQIYRVQCSNHSGLRPVILRRVGA